MAPGVLVEDHASGTDRARLILSIALSSGNRSVADLLTKLLVETRMAHGSEVTDLLDRHARHGAALRRNHGLNPARAHAAVDLAFERGGVGDLYALDNLLDVVGVLRA